MTKNEFVEYAAYLGKLFNFEAPADKEVLAAWYRNFERVHIDIAREMAQLYLKQETGRFKIAKLLEYKEMAMRGKTYKENYDNCKLCKNAGYLELEIRDKGRLYEFAYRCICKKGKELYSGFPLVREADLLERYRDYNDVYRLERPSFENVDVEEVKRSKLGGILNGN